MLALVGLLPLVLFESGALPGLVSGGLGGLLPAYIPPHVPPCHTPTYTPLQCVLGMGVLVVILDPTEIYGRIFKIFREPNTWSHIDFV